MMVLPHAWPSLFWKGGRGVRHFHHCRNNYFPAYLLSSSSSRRHARRFHSDVTSVAGKVLREDADYGHFEGSQGRSLPEKPERNCDLAIAYYDKFYGGLFGKEKWARVRAGLLSTPKYIAVPNHHTGRMTDTMKKLEELGARSFHDIWMEGKEKLGTLDPNLPVTTCGGNVNRLSAEETVMQEIADNYQGVHIDNEGYPYTVFDSRYYAPFSKELFGKLLRHLRYTEPSTAKQKSIEWPLYLRPYIFELDACRKFPKAAIDSESGLLECIYVNGASITPILALDLKPSVELLDICAGPGTKSLMALISTSVKTLVCNDLKSNRVDRTIRTLTNFTGTDLDAKFITFTTLDGRDYPLDKRFDRVLVDIPCSNDRASARVIDNNLFKVSRTEERLSLADLQKDILLRCLEAMKQENDCAAVYSTCTLSPAENDGVVLRALKETDVNNLSIDLFGLLSLLKPFELQGYFHMSVFRCGVLIEPDVRCNFGPMYISRIVYSDKDKT